MEVPAEVGSDRIGYIAVQFSESMKEATLMGFVKNVTGEEMPLEQWRSLDDFLELVSEPQTEPDTPPLEDWPTVAATPSAGFAYASQTEPKKPVLLSNWLSGVFEAGWEMVEAVEALLSLPEAEPSFNFRGGDPMKFRKHENSATGVRMLQLQKADDRVAIFVGFGPGIEPKLDIFVELFAVKPQTYLPLDLMRDRISTFTAYNVSNGLKNLRTLVKMINTNFRKLHRQVAPIIFLPLAIAAITGLAFSLAINWGKVEEDSVEILMKIHEGAYLGPQLKPIYVLLLGLGVIGMIVSGLTMSKLFGSARPERQESKLDFRKIHRLSAPIIFLPLTISAVTGIIYRIGRAWFKMSREVGETFLAIHTGEYFGNFLQPFYILLVGLGALLMLATGINMTGIFRKRRQ